jgi:tetratricopeptide (TPR) repeat protein
MPKKNINTILLFAIPFFATFLTYLKTVCPTVYTGDSGELAFAIHSMGIAHPPGYPLLTLLGKTFLTIMPGNAGYVLNILSSLFSSVAAGMAAFVVRILLFPVEYRQKRETIVISAAIAIMFGFCNALWAVAVGLEVYGLGMALLLISLFSLLKFNEDRDYRTLLISIYAFSLGLTNHLTISVLAFPIAIIMIKNRVPLRYWTCGAFLLIMSLCAYFYIPIRSSQNPIADWDHPANISVFFDHITARRYQGFISGFRFDNYFENIWRSIRIIAGQYPLWLGLLGAIGIFIARSIPKMIKLILALIVLFNILSVAVYDIPDIEQYYLPSIFIFTVGIAALAIRLFDIIASTQSLKASAAITILAALLTLGVNYSGNNQSDNRLAYEYGMNILNSVPQNSLLISIADNSNSSIYYLHYVEGLRKDLDIYDPVKTYHLLRGKVARDGSDMNLSGPELCYRALAQNQGRAFIVKEHMLVKGMPIDYTRLKITPQGMVYKIGTYPMEPNFWSKLTMPKFEDPEKILDFKGLTMLCNLYLCRGEDLQLLGNDSQAMSDYNFAAELASASTEASIHNSLGIFFRKMKKSGLAEQEYETALDSRHLTAFERANILVNLGNLRKDKGDFPEAMEMYNKALAINSDLNDAKYNIALTRAYSSLSQNNYAEAVRAFEEAVRLPAADPKLLFNIAVLYDKNLHDSPKAIENYNRFIQYAPGLPESQNAQRRVQELSNLQ